MSLRKLLPLVFVVCITFQGYSQINRSEFLNPPDSTRVLTWCHWINGHVSKTGIANDLECMKKVGIGGAVLFNVGFYPDGKVPFYSNAWWDHVEFALHKMDSLNLKFGVYNSDGWSMSGGPWISAEESMMQLTMSDTIIEGGSVFKRVLPQPPFQKVCYDVATIAYPYSPDDLPFKPEVVKACLNVNNSGFVIDDMPRTSAVFNYSADTIPYVVFDFEKQKRIQSLTVTNIQAQIFLDAKAYIEYSADSKNYKRINTELPLNLKSEGMNKSLSMSFPPIEARFIKLYIEFEAEAKGTPTTMTQSSVMIGDVVFNNTPSLTLWQPKSGASKRIRHDRQLLNIQELSSWDENEPADCTIQEKQIIDLTDKIDRNQTLTWNVPKGKWKVMRIAYTSTLKQNGPASELGRGYECNKMDSMAVKKHFNAYVGRINELSLKCVGKSIDFMQMESWEAGIHWGMGFFNL